MAAVVRVKRPLEEEPLDILVLSCKRRKIGNDDENCESEDHELSTVLKFAGTIKEDENVLAHLKKQNLPELQELKDQFKKHSVIISDKLRAQKQELSKSNRYKVVNCFRSQNLNSEEVDKPKSEYTIFDIENAHNDSCKTDNQNEGKTDIKYVYDLYYTNSDDFGDTGIEDYVRNGYMRESGYDFID